MAAPQRNPAGRYPAGRGRPPGARTQAPPVPPPQGLWQGHPSGPMPEAPPVWPNPPAGRVPSGQLPRRQTGPLLAAPGPVRQDILDRTTAQLRPAAGAWPAAGGRTGTGSWPATGGWPAATGPAPGGTATAVRPARRLPP